MGNLPFSIYFDFETTTGSAVFFDSKMYVVSYVMVVSFNKSLNFDKMVIHRNYQQTPEELYDISHFRQEHVPFFDQVTLRQLKNGVSAVAFKEKCTSLAEINCIELKFTIDSIELWFNKIIKPRFFEIQYSQKEHFRQKNPITNQTLCSICDFPMDPQANNGWLDHVIKAEHLFLKNIYDQDEMKNMEIDNLDNLDYTVILYRLLNIFEEFEDAFESGKMTEIVMDFLRGDLNLAATYEIFELLRVDIENINVPKKPFATNTEIFKENMTAFL